MNAPALFVFDHTDRVNAEALRTLGELALPACLAAARAGSPLTTLSEIEAAVLDDEALAEVHGRFLDDPSPTDVVTFDHGEILMSADMAERQAARVGHPFERELALYLIHGLLHLAGWSDHEPDAREEMAREQERILAEAWPL